MQVKRLDAFLAHLLIHITANRASCFGLGRDLIVIYLKKLALILMRIRDSGVRFPILGGGCVNIRTDEK